MHARISLITVALSLAAAAASHNPAPEGLQPLDKNHDGRIDLEEFYPTGPPPLHPRMKQVFESFDKDHSGSLSFADAAKVIATVSGVLPKLTPEISGELRTVPLQVHPRTKRAFVKATVNGVEGLFLLDTGTSDTILYPEFAKRARVDFVEICQTITAGNMGKHGDFVSLVRVPDLTIEAVHFRDFHAVLQPSKQATYEFGEAIAGLIGSSIIYSKPVTLDFRNGLMTYESLPAAHSAWTFPLHKDAKVAITDAEVDGVKFPLMMDSGASIGNSIMINEPYHAAIRKLAGDPKAMEYRAKTLSVAGQLIASNLRCRILPFEYSVFSSEFFYQHVISVDLAAAKAIILSNPIITPPDADSSSSNKITPQP